LHAALYLAMLAKKREKLLDKKLPALLNSLLDSKLGSLQVSTCLALPRRKLRGRHRRG